MSTVVLLLITFFTLYNGIRSKFTQEHIVKIGRWIDYHSIRFIRKFRDKSNKELFDSFHKHSVTLARAILAVALVIPFLGIKPFYTAFAFVGVLLLLIAVTTPKRLFKDLKTSLSNFSYTVLMTIGIMAFMWIHDLVTGQHILQDLLELSFGKLNSEIQQSGIDLTLFWVVALGIIIVSAFFNFILWAMLHGVMVAIIPLCRGYAKMCIWLNRTQPLKPAYIITKTIIIIIVHILTL